MRNADTPTPLCALLVRFFLVAEWTLLPRDHPHSPLLRGNRAFEFAMPQHSSCTPCDHNFQAAHDEPALLGRAEWTPCNALHSLGLHELAWIAGRAAGCGTAPECGVGYGRQAPPGRQHRAQHCAGENAKADECCAQWPSLPQESDQCCEPRSHAHGSMHVLYPAHATAAPQRAGAAKTQTTSDAHMAQARAHNPHSHRFSFVRPGDACRRRGGHA